MAEVLQQTVNGVVVGASYALIASGLTVIFGLMRIVNFAHGEFYMIGAVFMYYLAMSIGLNFFAAIFLSAVLTMVLGIIVDRLVLKPLRNAPMTSTTLATIGLSVLLQNLVLVTSGAMPKMINSPFAQAPLEIGSIIISSNRLFAAAVTLIVIVLADWALNHTSFGRDIRACFQDQDAAALVGISVNKVYAATFTVGAGMAALAGSLLGSIFLVYPTMGETAVSKAFTVVIAGGLEFPRCSRGGAPAGVIEALAAGVSAGYKDAIGFILIVCFLLYQPCPMPGELGRWDRMNSKMLRNGIVVAVLLALPWVSNSYRLHLIIVSMLYMLTAIGLNLVLGYFGEMSLGQVAFFGTGAYTTAILTLKLGMPMGVSVLAGAVMASLLGWFVALPVFEGQRSVLRNRHVERCQHTEDTLCELGRAYEWTDGPDRDTHSGSELGRHGGECVEQDGVLLPHARLGGHLPPGGEQDDQVACGQGMDIHP